MIAAVIVILTLLLLIFSFIAFHLYQSSKKVTDELDRMQNRVNSHLEQTAQLAQKTGDGAVKAIGELYTRLGKLEETGNKIFEVGKEIGKLQDVLRAPKARGGFGESMLTDLLGQMIPRDHFELQHQFRNGTRVDAVIFVGDYLVPVDAKFPLESFERIRALDSADDKKKGQKDFIRDIKKHIDDIADRYISPDEGTLDFALMYIPAENVYYEVITLRTETEGAGLSDYAMKRRVIPVSPNSFYAYLQVILMGLRGLRMDQATKEIAESLLKLRSDLERIVSDYSTLGTHLSHAHGSYEKIQRSLDRFQGKFSLLDQTKSISEEEKEVENAGPLKEKEGC